MSRKFVIAVIGTGQETEPAVSNAREIGRMVAEYRWVLITGGRNAGVMRAANQGASAVKGSLAIGILPNEETEISPDVDVAIVTDVGEARNNIIVLSADVVIACGVDDAGTASEIALALKAGKPVILIDPSDAAGKFFAELVGHKIQVVNSPVDAIKIAEKLLTC